MGGFNLTGVPVQETKSAADAAPGEATVTMVFPRDVILVKDGTLQRILFRQGIQEVPESLANHPWLKANDVRMHVKPRPQPLQLTPAMLTYLQAHGYCTKGTAAEQYAAGQAKLDNMSLEDQRSFMADFTSGKPEPDDEEVPPVPVVETPVVETPVVVETPAPAPAKVDDKKKKK